MTVSALQPTRAELARFPFLGAAKQLLVEEESGDASADDLLVKYPKALTLAEKYLLGAVNDLRLPDPSGDATLEVVAHATCRLMLAALNDPWAWQRFIEAWKQRNTRELATYVRNRPGRARYMDRERLLGMVRGLLHWDVERIPRKLEAQVKDAPQVRLLLWNRDLGRPWAVRGRLHEYRMVFTDYLQAAPKLKDESRKLANSVLAEGKVYIKGDRALIRLIAEGIKDLMRPVASVSRTDVPTIPEGPATQALQRVKRLVESKHGKERAKQRASTPDLALLDGLGDAGHPPCVRTILSKNTRSENLTHNERLFLTFYLLRLGWSVDSLVDLFRPQPDFSEKTTRYHVQHAAKGKYMPHGCEKLASLSMCFAEDDQMCADRLARREIHSKRGKFSLQPFKNPIQFPAAKLWLHKKK